MNFRKDEVPYMIAIIAQDIRQDWYYGVKSRISEIKELYDYIGEECPEIPEGVYEDGRYMRDSWDGYYDLTCDISFFSKEAKEFLRGYIDNE